MHVTGDELSTYYHGSDLYKAFADNIDSMIDLDIAAVQIAMKKSGFSTFDSREQGAVSNPMNNTNSQLHPHHDENAKLEEQLYNTSLKNQVTVLCHRAATVVIKNTKNTYATVLRYVFMINIPIF